MNWNIITGSKGGIGKTMITMLLLGHFLESAQNDQNDQRNGVLVIDLNGMNTDSSAILLYRNVGNEDHMILKGENNEPIVRHNNGEQLVFKEAVGLSYVVGRHVNPFELYSPMLFNKLLIAIKEKCEQPNFAKKLGLDSIKNIIIDTNYHFCNIFSQDEDDYTLFKKGALSNDNMKIWFMWVHRQLLGFMPLDKTDTVNTIVRNTADLIDKNLREPFIHVFSPLALFSSDFNKDKVKKDRGLISAAFGRLLNAQNASRNHTIDILKSLETENVVDYIGFSPWVRSLYEAYNVIDEQANVDPHYLLLELLYETMKNGRPKNVFPLAEYHPALMYYTDKERRYAVGKLCKFAIYTNFKNLYLSMVN